MRVRVPVSASKDLALGLGGFGVLVLIWCAVTYGGLIKPLFLPTPTNVWEGWVHFNQLGWLFPAILRSTFRVLLSLLLVVLVGVPIGVLMGAYSPIDSLLNRIINSFKAVPPTGLIGLIILWFSVEEKAKIVFLFLGSIFYMIVLVRNAILDVREEYLNVARDIGANGFQMLTKVLLPAALPQIADAVIVCNGIMWTYIVLAEYINSNEEQLGLGYLLTMGSKTFQSGQVYGALILIGGIAYISDWLLRFAQKRLFRWM